MLPGMSRFQQVIVGALGLILVYLVVESLIPDTYVPVPREPVEEVACIGEAIKVDFPFEGQYLEPWTCQIQCDDGKARYIVYSNGKATQCETPPGCNDLGEDTGVTCIVPGA